MGPKFPPSNNVIFGEMEHTEVLGNIEIASKTWRHIKQRFKLVSGACANLLPIGIYSQHLTKSDRDLKASIDHRISLLTANSNEIKQLGTVRLRIKAGG